MTESERLYDVAGVTFGVKLEAPWSFMHYTEPVAERIKIAAAGGIVPVMPTRAGDSEPPRTYVQKRGELPEDYGPHVLDFSQYEPFATEESSKIDFRLTVCNGQPDEFRQAQKEGQVTKLMSETEVLPYYYVYRWKEGTVFEFEGADGKIDSTLFVENGAESGYFWAGEKMRPYSVIFQICFALRIMYTYNSWKYKAILMHSSVIAHNGSAVLFLGTSGTGKSTHSRLWLENIPGAELLNDDNPVLRIEEGKVNAYGTPWSGKTPCYRKSHLPVRALVRLHQAPANEVKQVKGLDAFAGVISSASNVKWDKKVMDGVMSIMSQIVMTVKCLSMGCLPDKAAAEMCCAETEK